MVVVFSSRRRHTRCALVTGVQTCALPIYADGQIILDFKQAQDSARKWFLELHRNGGRKVGVYTVSDALDDYLEGFQGKDLTNTRRRIEALIRPNLGHYEVSKLEPKTITDWMNKIAS